MNEPTIEDLVTALGGPANTDPEPAPTPDPEPNPNPNPDPAPAQDPEPKPNPEPTPDPEPDPKPNKAQEAFAAMRIQNKRQSELLKGVASVLELDENDMADETKLLDAIQARVLSKQAETSKIPVEVLQKINTLEARENQRQAERLEMQTALGFQNVQKEFGLNQEQLNSFAKEMGAKGINPFETEVNMVSLYKDWHFKDLVDAAIAKAVAEEQNRATKANQQSSNPGTLTGAPGGGEPTKVNSVRELNAWFKNQEKN